MSGRNTVVSSLPARVPLADYEACPVTEVFRRFGDKWTLVTLMLLSQRTHRFNELQHRIEGISQRMLTRTLRGLESDGLVLRTVHPTVPPSVEYSLTLSGRDLLGPISAIATWATTGATAETPG
ncbi:winged helix-turn-helix transcriptional regulator [Cryptosporangium sp. NPDC051539]|uniref:winged helix-turn-helix transcriptional regulator n=1 Tax=Cryptosporangium sp. NPDC051539 TaxID=3363962 RepID=UPI0037AA5516